MRPPNSSTSFRESLRDVHGISSCRRLRPGFEMIASLPPERASKIVSCAPNQRGSAIFRHRYIASGSACHARFVTDLCVVVGLPRYATLKKRLERVSRLELATSSLARRCSTTELHPQLEGVEIMAQQAHSATVNSAEWQSARVMQDSLPLRQRSNIRFLRDARSSANSPSAAI